MAKRTNIRRRGRGWVVYYRVDGKQVYRRFRTREDAELELARVQTQKARGEARRPPARVRFADFAEEWLRDYAKGNVRVQTYEAYEGSLRVHLVPEFGNLYVSEITRKAIDAFVADWSAGGPRYQGRVARAREAEATRAREKGRDPRPITLGRAPGTISNALTPLREMLGHAVEWGILHSNPALGVRRPRVERKHMHVLTADEIGKLLAAARPEWRTFFLSAVTTGLRRGELLGLRVGDFQSTKTAGSVRAVAMPPTLASALRRHVMASPFKDPDDLLFPNSKGGPLDGHNLVERQFKPTLRRAGLPQIRFHDLRHTFASLLIAQGEHPKYIAEQLGHASVQITLDRYGHLMPQSYDHAGERLEAALFGRGAEEQVHPLASR
jgi:integrase